MTLTIEKKQSVIKENQQHPQDTGSAEVQIALLTERINYLTEHFKQHPKDFNSRWGLIKIVSHRSSLLKYLARTDRTKYQNLIKRLGIRK